MRRAPGDYYKPRSTSTVDLFLCAINAVASTETSLARQNIVMLNAVSIAQTSEFGDNLLLPVDGRVQDSRSRAGRDLVPDY